MSENDTVAWSSDRLLSWHDFKAELNPAFFEDSHSVVKYRYAWTVDSENENGNIMFLIKDIQLYAEFHPLLSWVRSSESTDALLNHEQGHFDLAEFVKRENTHDLHTAFYGKTFPTRGKNEEQRKQFAREDSGKLIFDKVRKLEELLELKRKEYDEKTEFGKNVKMQLEYDSKFSKLRM